MFKKFPGKVGEKDYSGFTLLCGLTIEKAFSKFKNVWQKRNKKKLKLNMAVGTLAYYSFPTLVHQNVMHWSNA